MQILAVYQGAAALWLGVKRPLRLSQMVPASSGPVRRHAAGVGRQVLLNDSYARCYRLISLGGCP